MGALEALSRESVCQRITEEELSVIRSYQHHMVAHYQRKELAEYFRMNQRIHEANF